MKSKTAERTALVLIPLATILAVVAAIGGDWIVFAAMVLIVFSQALSLRALRRRRGRHETASTESA